MKRTLEELEQAITVLMDELLDVVPDVDVEPTPEQQERMRELERELDALVSQESTKVDSVARVLQRFEEQGAACEAEAKRLDRRAVVCFNKARRLKDHIVEVMLKWDIKKLTGTYVTMTRTQNPPRVEVAQPLDLPFSHQQVTYILKPLDESVRDAIEAFIRVHFKSGDLVLERIVKPKKDLVRDDIGRPAMDKAGAVLVPGTWRLTLR